MTKLLTNIHNWKFVMNDSRIKFNIQRWCFWILIRSMFVEQNNCSFSLMKFDFEHLQNVQFRRQIIREILCIWRFSNFFFHNFSNKRLNRFVETTKTQIKNHQNLHHRFSFCLHQSKIFRFQRFQWIFIATRNQWNQTYVWRMRKTWKKNYHSWYFISNFEIFRYSHQKECNFTRRILFCFCKLFTHQWTYLIKNWFYCWIQQMTRYSFLRDFFWRLFHFNAFCFENEFVSQKCFDIHCNHERRRLCDDFIAQFLRTIFDFNVCSFISNRSIQNFQCKIRHHHIAQRDLRYKARKLLFESFFSSKCCNWNSQRKSFWRFDSTFEKMKIRNVFVVHRIQQEIHFSNFATSSKRLNCFLFRLFDDDVVFRRVLKLWKNN